MSGFIHEDFLLSTESSRRLYHEFAADMPIIDYHNHLSSEQLAGNHQFEDITEVWLAGDHYKWRAMRANGVDEKYITGSATAADKFTKWAETVPYTLGNPLYHWTHLELFRYFHIDELLNGDNAKRVFHHCNELLQQDDYRARNLVTNKNVEVLCTTDDPADHLNFHQQLKKTQNDLRVLPTFRPDKMCMVQRPDYRSYIHKLSETGNLQITTFQDLLDVAKQRIEDFHLQGCRLSDHGLSYLPNVDHNQAGSSRIFDKVMDGKTTSDQEAAVFMITVLHYLCQWYAEKGWTQQFHLGAIRNTNTRLLDLLGADVGVDSMGDWQQMQGLARFLDQLNMKEKLAKTILYNNNPRDNASFATMMANFNEHPTPGKMQFGASWWFLDQYHGIVTQLQDLSNFGLLSRFVGMITDSRSFLSFPRHEYFRRVLCDELGNEMVAGRLPEDMDMIGSMVKNICYFNARNYFNFE